MALRRRMCAPAIPALSPLIPDHSSNDFVHVHKTNALLCAQPLSLEQLLMKKQQEQEAEAKVHSQTYSCQRVAVK